MKKSIITLMSLVVLASCSKDEYEPMYEGQNQGPETQNSVRTVDTNLDYESPYFYPFTGHSIKYVFINETDKDIEFVPFIGLAYHDGNDGDGTYFSTVLNSTLYPYFNFNGVGEATKIFQCNPIKIAANSYEVSNNGQHLPVLASGFPSGQVFNPNNAIVTASERQLLQDYGKVYHVEIFPGSVQTRFHNTTNYTNPTPNPLLPGPAWNTLPMATYTLWNAGTLAWNGTSREVNIVDDASKGVPSSFTKTTLYNGYYFDMYTNADEVIFHYHP